MNLLLFRRIPFCLRFDKNKWLWDLEGLIWNSTCLAVKTREWNNCFSAGNQTWGDMAEEKSGIIFISLPLEMWYAHPIHPCLHQRRMKARPEKKKKVLFITATWIIYLVEFAPSHVIDYKSFLKQRNTRVQVSSRNVKQQQQPIIQNVEDSWNNFSKRKKKNSLILNVHVSMVYSCEKRQTLCDLIWKARLVSPQKPVIQLSSDTLYSTSMLLHHWPSPPIKLLLLLKAAHFHSSWSNDCFCELVSYSCKEDSPWHRYIKTKTGLTSEMVQNDVLPYHCPNEGWSHLQVMGEQIKEALSIAAELYLT